MAVAYINRKNIFHPTVQVVLAAVLFGIAAIFAQADRISPLETHIFRAIYDLPMSLRWVFLAITQLGSVYTLVILSALAALRGHYHIVLRLLMTGSLAYLLAGMGKDWLGRPRPDSLLSNVIQRDYFVKGAGFPSGHTALVTAMGLVIAHYMPHKYRWAAWSVISLVALSRIYLGVHAPLDIVGGFAIGWASYALFRHVRLVDIRSNRPKSVKK